MTVGGGTVEQQKIEKLISIEEELLTLIDRTSKVNNSHPEWLRATRLLNQIQLKRLELEIQNLR